MEKTKKEKKLYNFATYLYSLVLIASFFVSLTLLSQPKVNYLTLFQKNLELMWSILPQIIGFIFVGFAILVPYLSSVKAQTPKQKWDILNIRYSLIRDQFKQTFLILTCLFTLTGFNQLNYSANLIQTDFPQFQTKVSYLLILKTPILHIVLIQLTATFFTILSVGVFLIQVFSLWKILIESSPSETLTLLNEKLAEQKELRQRKKNKI